MVYYAIDVVSVPHSNTNLLVRTYNNCVYYSNYCASICNNIIIYKSVLALFSLHVALGKTRTICTWLFSACFWAWEEGHHDVGSALGAFLWQTPRRSTGMLDDMMTCIEAIIGISLWEQDVINHHQSHGRKQYWLWKPEISCRNIMLCKHNYIFVSWKMLIHCGN